MGPDALSLIPPYLHVIARPTEDRLPHAWPLPTLPAGAVARRVRANKMRNVVRLFDELAAAFQFPPYFGEHWAALEECLADLDWISAGAYLTIVWDAEQLLPDASCDDMTTFMRVLQRVAAGWSRPVSQGEAWDRPAVPFHVFFVVPENHVARFSAKLESLGMEIVK